MKTAQQASLSPVPASRETLSRIAAGEYHDPHGVLGAHPSAEPNGGVTIRTLRPMADGVT